jgi:MraZ protein
VTMQPAGVVDPALRATAPEPGAPGAAAAPAPVSLRFTGRYRHTLDAKFRLVLPAPFRGAFAGGGHLSVWGGECVAVLPPAEFDRWVETTRRQLEGSGLDDPAGLMRWVHLRTHTFRPDVQGRFLLPDELRQAIGVDHEVVIAGNDARLELWHPGEDLADRTEHEDNISFFQTTYDLLGRD